MASRTTTRAAAVVAGVGGLAAAGMTAGIAATARQAKHPADDAPGRTARNGNFGDYEVVGNAVTIDRPRHELYAFWRDFQNLANFMENIEGIRPTASDRAIWTLKAPAGLTVDVETEIVTDRPD